MYRAEPPIIIGGVCDVVVVEKNDYDSDEVIEFARQIQATSLDEEGCEVFFIVFDDKRHLVREMKEECLREKMLTRQREISTQGD